MCVVVLSAASAGAQDIHFSQFYLSPLNLNPAMTGVMNCNIRLVGNYRNQWGSVLKANAFNTYSFSYDQRIPVGRYDYFGVGGTFWGDKAGEAEFATIQGRLSGSYSKRMGGYRDKSHYLVVGADAGITQRSVDFQRLRWGSQHDLNGGFDPTLGTGEPNTYDPNFIFADISAGLLWFTVFNEDNNFYIGGAYHHLNQANVSFNRNTAIFEQLYAKITVHAGGEFMLADRFGLVPGIIAMRQGPSFQLNTGTSMKFLLGGNKRSYQAFQIGAWARLANQTNPLTTPATPLTPPVVIDATRTKIGADAIIISSRFDYDDFSIGFSYDINVSNLRTASNSIGGFEFALVYKICGPEKRNVYCPNF